MTRAGTSGEGVGMIETFLEKVNHDFPDLEARRVAPLKDEGTFFQGLNSDGSFKVLF